MSVLCNVKSMYTFLQEHYSEFALFFYDPYGGNTIGALWKPSALETKNFKVNKTLEGAFRTIFICYRIIMNLIFTTFFVVITINIFLVNFQFKVP